MIGYRISETDLRTKLEAAKPGWLQRAVDRTDAFRRSGKYEEKSGIWSEIKSAYMDLQHDKCAYCERLLTDSPIEHDLEHFRPKSKARPWRASARMRSAGVNLTSPVAGKYDPGYYLLAYHPFNYCTACKTCNSALKSDYFPIEGLRQSHGEDPRLLTSERPLLIYPIGDVDEDPERLIDFYGVSPRARANAGRARRRALVTIAFFKLDARDKRKDLLRERGMYLQGIYPWLRERANPSNAADKKRADRVIESMQRSSAPHASCIRSFIRLFRSDENEADRVLWKINVEFVPAVRSPVAPVRRMSPADWHPPKTCTLTGASISEIASTMKNASSTQPPVARRYSSMVL